MGAEDKVTMNFFIVKFYVIHIFKACFSFFNTDVLSALTSPSSVTACDQIHLTVLLLFPEIIAFVAGIQQFGL